MAEMECPYDELTLNLALLSLNKNMLDDKLANKINIKLSKYIIKDKVELNKQIAESNGIEVLDLINSPNYAVLKKEFSQSFILKIIGILKEENLTDKEAWAVLVAGTGGLKELF